MSAILANIGQNRLQAVWSIVQIATGAFLLALCAQIKIPLPFTPIPLTLQTLMVMLLGCQMGSKQGTASVALYCTAALFGLPVLAGGRSDMLWLITPPAGYLIGMMVQAYLVGLIAEKGLHRNSTVMFFSLLLACFAQLAIGSAWLGVFIGFKPALIAGIFPFVPGEILKVMAVVALRKYL